MRNIIQHKFFIVLSDECKELPQEERNKLASAAWKLKNKKEKEVFKQTSKDMKSVKINSLSGQQKTKLIAHQRKKILEEVYTVTNSCSIIIHAIYCTLLVL